MGQGRRKSGVDDQPVGTEAAATNSQRLIALAVLVTTLFWLLVGGAMLVLLRRPAPIAFKVQPPPATATPLPTATPSPLVVQVTGAVIAPGVFQLPAGSRLMDALEAAGGPASDAELGTLNLASALLDGDKLVVPAMGAIAPPPLAAVAALTETQRSGNSVVLVSGASLININTATLEELDTLPGIGPKTAQAILDYRQANGSFKSVDDLLNVKGIGDATLAKIRDLVTVAEAP